MPGCSEPNMDLSEDSIPPKANTEDPKTSTEKTSSEDDSKAANDAKVKPPSTPPASPKHDSDNAPDSNAAGGADDTDQCYQKGDWGFAEALRYSLTHPTPWETCGDLDQEAKDFLDGRDDNHRVLAHLQRVRVRAARGSGRRVPQPFTMFNGAPVPGSCLEEYGDDEDDDFVVVQKDDANEEEEDDVVVIEREEADVKQEG